MAGGPDRPIGGDARLGHADVNITARIYSHALPDDDVRAADTWEAIADTWDETGPPGFAVGLGKMTAWTKSH